LLVEPESIPDGYVPHLRSSPVTDPWLPLFARTQTGIVNLALRVRPAHCNGKGFLHGGVINAMADNAMGLSVIETLSQRGIARSRGGSTVSLSLDFLSSAQVGQWVEFLPRILKIGSGIGFADCLVLADSQTIARGNATHRFYTETRAATTSERSNAE
jgi:acyl-coenzyme A thioesterase PaaI-like protein